MDWKSFVGSHPGSPPIAKMRGQRLYGGVLAHFSKESAMDEAGIFGSWLRETGRNLEIRNLARAERLSRMLAAVE